MEQSKTTRDELAKAIADGRECGGHYNCGALPDEIAEAGRDLDAYLNAYAHQLAEQIRHANRDTQLAEGHRRDFLGSAGAADLIDPQAQRTTEPVPVEPTLTEPKPDYADLKEAVQRLQAFEAEYSRWVVGESIKSFAQTLDQVSGTFKPNGSPRQLCLRCGGYATTPAGLPLECCSKRAQDEEAAQHRYVSTACHHARHSDCRRTCKYCPAPCRCTCHKETP